MKPSFPSRELETVYNTCSLDAAMVEIISIGFFSLSMYALLNDRKWKEKTLSTKKKNGRYFSYGHICAYSLIWCCIDSSQPVGSNANASLQHCDVNTVAMGKVLLLIMPPSPFLSSSSERISNDNYNHLVPRLGCKLIS